MGKKKHFQWFSKLGIKGLDFISGLEADKKTKGSIEGKA